MAVTKYQCSSCGKSKNVNDFYSSSSPIYKYYGKLSVCKDCFLSLVDEENMRSVTNALRMIDKPFLSELWQSSIKEVGDSRKSVFRTYMKNVGMQQYRNLSWDDSLFGSDISITKTKNEKGIIEPSITFTEEEVEQLIDFWGRGYSKEEYEFLQNEYEKFVNSYECESYAMEMLFQEASHQRLAIKRKREKGEPVDKELKTLQDLLGSANVKPMQETGANAAEQATFGTLIKKYENEKPIPKPEQEWKDVDGIKKYMNVWFLGHLCKMIGVQNEYSEMYEKEIAKFTVDAPDEEDESDEL